MVTFLLADAFHASLHCGCSSLHGGCGKDTMEGVQNMVIVAYCWQHTETTLTAKPHHSSTRTMVRLFLMGNIS